MLTFPRFPSPACPAATGLSALICLALSPIASAIPSSGQSGGTAGGASVWIPRVEVRTGPENSGELTVNDQTVLRLRETQGGLLPSMRAEILANRLRTVLQSNPTPYVEVSTTTDKHGHPLDASLRVGRQVLLSLTTLEARSISHSQEATPAAVVRPWASRLRAALALPGLRGPAAVIVPEGEIRSLTISGAARGPIAAGIEPTPDTAPAAAAVPTPALAGVSVAEGTNTIRIEGRHVGNGIVHLEREGAVWNIRIAVRRWAATPAENPEPIRLTGSADAPYDDRSRGSNTVPAIDPAAIQHLAVARAIGSLHLEPDALVRLSDSPATEKNGGAFVVPLRVQGPGLLPVALSLRVPVERGASEVAPQTHTVRLLYSNAPERVTRLQTLFTGQLAPRSEGSTRLLFHHQSALRRSALFQVSLLNDSDTDARVEVRGGVAGPVVDTVWVGVRAGEAFLKAQRQKAGCVLAVPAHSRVPIVVERLPAGQTLSGLCELLQTSGDTPLQVQVVAGRLHSGVFQQVVSSTGVVAFLPAPLLPAAPPSAALSAVATEGPSYSDPRIHLSARYSVGEAWRFLRLGRREDSAATITPGNPPGNKPSPATTPNDSAEPDLAGHYGFTYQVDCVLDNPSDHAGIARLVFEPSAGLAGGVFIVDGVKDNGQTDPNASTTITVPQAREDREVELTRVALPPGATRRLRVTTIPLSGSNYPARLIIRP